MTQQPTDDSATSGHVVTRQWRDMKGGANYLTRQPTNDGMTRGHGTEANQAAEGRRDGEATRTPCGGNSIVPILNIAGGGVS